MLRSNLCDYADAYVHTVNERIAITGAANNDAAND